MAGRLFAYAANHLIDVGNGIIVVVEATTAIRQAEGTGDKRRIERTQDRFGLWPARLLGDRGYGSAEMLGWRVEARGVEPHVTVFDKSKRTEGTFSREDFVYDREQDVYRRPAPLYAPKTNRSDVGDGVRARRFWSTQTRPFGHADRWRTAADQQLGRRSNAVRKSAARAEDPPYPYWARHVQGRRCGRALRPDADDAIYGRASLSLHRSRRPRSATATEAARP